MTKVLTQWLNSKRIRRGIALCLLTILLILYPTVIEPGWIQVVALDLTLPHLDPAFENYRVVHLTDIHADDWMTPKRLRSIVDRVNRFSPDAVALTGDFVTIQPERYRDTLMELNALTPKDGTFAVLGNHDHWSNPQEVRQSLAAANVIVLRNDSRSIIRDGKILAIAGVDDVWVQADDLDLVLAQLPKDGAHLLLAHEPDFADQSAATQSFDLELSGHAHGGQVKLPVLGAPQLPPFGRRYPFGLYQVGEMKQYTSRGVGMVSPRVRLNARPEITVITLHAPSSPT